MQRTRVELPAVKLVGLTARTNNRDEMSPEGGKIPAIVQQYMTSGIAGNIPHRKRPGVVYCAYLDYESDHNGPYTFLIGEEVDSFDGVPGNLVCKTIEPQTYVKHTGESGPMPQVVMGMWKQIWEGGEQALGASRKFHADFEVYDERARDPQNTTLDIYIGVESDN